MAILKNLFLILATFFFCCGGASLFAENQKNREGSVLIAILARNKAFLLKEYLKTIENLDYDKKLISLYINTNNNVDETESILLNWIQHCGLQYHTVDFENQEYEPLESTSPHTWGPTRFKIMAEIRNKSLQKAKERKCQFYFVVDCDNFIAPHTLKSLIAHNKPIIAPMLKAIPETNDPYSNYFCAISPRGYYRKHRDYLSILHRHKIGVFQVPLVHCTYLIQSQYIDYLNYSDGSDDYEFVIFSRIARNNCINQYICNDQNYGTLLHFFKNLTAAEEANRFVAFISKLPEGSNLYAPISPKNSTE